MALVVVSAQQAAKYPAGVDPALCPDFPNCNNELLHGAKSAASTLPIHENPLWNAHAVPGVPTTLTPAAPQPQWNSAPAAQPQWNAAPQQQQWNAAPVQPQWNAAPAQPQWNAAPAVWNFAPAHVQDQFSQWNPQQAAAPQPQWNSAPAAQPDWNAAPQPQQWNAAPAAQPQAYAPVNTNEISDTVGGDKYPAGVNPASCPNYPYCDTNTGLHAGVAAPAKAAPLPGYTERQYPAGVNPQTCINFPYCH